MPELTSSSGRISRLKCFGDDLIDYNYEGVLKPEYRISSLNKGESFSRV